MLVGLHVRFIFFCLSLSRAGLGDGLGIGDGIGTGTERWADALDDGL